MRIEKINNYKLKIMFNSKELEENHISVHSFLSGSNEAQRLVTALLDIANEDLGFDIKNCNISSETFSFENKEFIIYVTKNTLSFIPPLTSEKLIYKLNSIEEVFEFCKYINLEVPIKNLTNSLYKYNDSFFIIIDIKKLTSSQRQLIMFILSEYQNCIYLSPIAYTKLIEHSILILENRAIQAL